jgi:hypothetical protein
MAAHGKALAGVAALAAVLVAAIGWWTFRRTAPSGKETTAKADNGKTEHSRPGLRSREAAASRVSPPRLAPHQPRVSNEPSDPHYRSFDLRRAGVASAEIFETEPRVDAWASVMEERLRSQLTPDLRTMVPSAIVNEIACRMSVCRVLLELPGDAQPGALMGALQIAPLAKAQSIEGLNGVDPDGRWRATYYSFHDHRENLDDQMRAYQEGRKEWLARMKPGVGRAKHIKQLPKE